MTEEEREPIIPLTNIGALCFPAVIKCEHGHDLMAIVFIITVGERHFSIAQVLGH